MPNRTIISHFNNYIFDYVPEAMSSAFMLYQERPSYAATLTLVKDLSVLVTMKVYDLLTLQDTLQISGGILLLVVIQGEN